MLRTLRPWLLATTVAMAGLSAAPDRSMAQGVVEAEQKAAIREIVRDYLLEHPEIIQEALTELERRQVAEIQHRQRDAISARKAQLMGEGSRTIGGDPNGEITIVEFFDYNCSFCKRAHADLENLKETIPNLRVVYVEWPFLSQESLDATRVSLAVAEQAEGGRYEEYHTALLLNRAPANEARALEVAEAMGFDIERIKSDMNSSKILSSLESNMVMAQAIGVTGTPAYVIGEQLILGAQGYDTLLRAINQEREGG